MYFVESDIVSTFVPTSFFDAFGFAPFQETGVGRFGVDARSDFVAVAPSAPASAVGRFGRSGRMCMIVIISGFLGRAGRLVFVVDIFLKMKFLGHFFSPRAPRPI